jgi:hypothetical protein
MAVVINEFEVSPAAEPKPAPDATRTKQGNDPAQPETLQKIEKALRVAHERSHRLVAH